MENAVHVVIYGDSIMRAMVPDKNFHYHSLIGGFLEKVSAGFGLQIKNRSRFGSTIERGFELLRRDLSKGTNCRYALLEYGGNDCNFDWHRVAEDPEGVHNPHTGLQSFTQILEEMAGALAGAGVQPVLMTLPPLDAQRYLDFIGRDGTDKGRILHWLGDVQMIYRFHEMYSGAIARLAQSKRIPLVDVRSRFLDKHNYRTLISEDGIHPSATGYALICSAFESFLRERTGALPA